MAQNTHSLNNTNTSAASVGSKHRRTARVIYESTNNNRTSANNKRSLAVASLIPPLAVPETTTAHIINTSVGANDNSILMNPSANKKNCGTPNMGYYGHLYDQNNTANTNGTHHSIRNPYNHRNNSNRHRGQRSRNHPRDRQFGCTLEIHSTATFTNQKRNAAATTTTNNNHIYDMGKQSNHHPTRETTSCNIDESNTADILFDNNTNGISYSNSNNVTSLPVVSDQDPFVSSLDDDDNDDDDHF